MIKISALKMLVKMAHNGYKITLYSENLKTGIQREFIPELGDFFSEDELYWATIDDTTDAFDIAYFEFENEMERINKLSRKKRKKELKRRKAEIHCLDCENQTIYDTWCCRYDFDGYPYNGHKCFAFNKDI